MCLELSGLELGFGTFDISNRHGLVIFVIVYTALLCNVFRSVLGWMEDIYFYFYLLLYLTPSIVSRIHLIAVDTYWWAVLIVSAFEVMVVF